MKAYLQKTFLLALVYIYSAGVLFAQKQTIQSFRSKFGPNAYVGYWAYVPEGYKTSLNVKYPLLVFLHGSGEKEYMAEDSSDIHKIKTHGPPKLIEAGWKFPFIVISPQCPFSDWENVTTDNYQTEVLKPGEFVDEIIEEIKKKYRVDEKRIYLTGLSMGGAATWSYIMNNPEKIAAAIPISSWIDDPDKVCNIAGGNVGVWAFQNSDDKVKGETITGFTDAINTCEPAPDNQARATIYNSDKHDAWTQSYNNSGVAPENIYDWLLTHSKETKVVTATDREIYTEGNSFSLFPIPAGNTVDLSYTAASAGMVNIEINDLQSRTILNKKIQVSKGQNAVKIDLTDVPDGSYIFSLSTSGESRSAKLIVDKE